MGEGDRSVGRGKEEVRGSGERVDRTFTLVLLPLVAVAAVLVAVLVAPTSLPASDAVGLVDGLLAGLGLLPREHAVVLDAGSTGSRVLAYTFHRHLATGRLVLDAELWLESQPGLSSYAGAPADGAASLAGLLAAARERVPAALHAATPVTLMATAGLRLLPAAEAEALLAAAAETLEGSGFHNRGVAMMRELDEGVFGWLTVNYLLEQLDSPMKSYVALDLGGGSTQVTFAPRHAATFAGAPEGFLHPVRVAGEEVQLYSHSYLGLGLMSARQAIFALDEEEGAAVAASGCVVGAAVHFRGVEVRPAAMAGYEACMVEVARFLDTLAIHQVEELPSRKIAAFSYFHDRAVDAGMLAAGESGVVTVQQYLAAAEAACAEPVVSQPFLCTDLTFIAGLLHHGYRLQAQARLGLYKQIGGYQTSWGLGAAFHLLE